MKLMKSNNSGEVLSIHEFDYVVIARLSASSALKWQILADCLPIVAAQTLNKQDLAAYLLPLSTL